jgi:hypothetical protein
MTHSNPATQRPRLSVSTWSLHRTLGDPQIYGPESGQQIPIDTHGRGALSLLELPAHLARFGITTLEICHFHLPSLDSGYLAELRAALADANVELFSLLIDSGDIVDPQHGERDLAWISSWLDVASKLGAQRARVIAGKSDPTADALATSIQRMQYLAEQAEAKGLRLMTENWFGLLSRPRTIHTLFDQLDGRIGLCFDFGNWRGPNKYVDLQDIAPYAESCHTKAHFDPPYQIDKEDYIRCLDITKAANFAGPYTLIYDGPGDDEWAGLALEREVVQPYL